MNRDLVIAIDQGTTGTTVLVVDAARTVRGRGYREFAQIYPRPGEVEHDPEALWGSVTGALGDALAGVDARRIAALGITNQRETTLLWERDGGRPVANAIVWQDRRTAPFCAELKAAGHERAVRERTGLVLDPYFSATKIAGCSTTWTVCAPARRRGRSPSGPSTASSSGASPAAALTPPTSPTPHAHCSAICGRGASPTSSARFSAFRPRSCPRSARRRGRSARRAACRGSPTGFRSPAWRAISRRPSTARTAPRRATPSAPSGRAPSC